MLRFPFATEAHAPRKACLSQRSTRTVPDRGHGCAARAAQSRARRVKAPVAPERFQLLRPLGRGSLGAVYAAHDHLLKRIVALKLVALGAGRATADRELAQARFRAETQAARRLVHPDIVVTLDSGCDDESGWLVMELVPGTALSRYTAMPRLLPESKALGVAERLAAALAYAHGAGVLHRDVKPANVLVDWRTDSVKLADFGTAHVVGGESTRTGVWMGTPAYLAPEVLAGEAPSAQSDLYALGVTLFQMLCGKLPHEGASLGQWLRIITQEPAPELSSLRPDLPAEWGALLRRLLARRPKERPGDGLALAAELRALRPPHSAAPGAAGAA